MNIKYIAILGIFLFSGSVSAQNDYQLSQYFQNAPAVNPAFTGVDNFLDIRAGYRQQWAGLDNTSRTYYVSLYTLLKRSKYEEIKSNALRISDPSLFDEDSTEEFNRSAAIKHGIGGYVINDHFGPFNRLYGFLSYAFHYPLSRKLNFTLGVSAGMNYNQIDTDQITVHDPDLDDTYQAFIANGASSTHFNLNVGGLLYSERFYLGYAAKKLMQNEVFLNDALSNERETINHILSAGYKFDMGSNYYLLPSVMVNYNDLLPSVVDMNLKFLYDKSLWGGVSYRNSEAVVLMAGFYINSKYSFGYSYDFAVNGINEYLKGSHEFVLGFHLSNPTSAIPFSW